MIQRIGDDQILSMLLAQTPDRSIDVLVTPSPEDTAALVQIRDDLAVLAAAAEPVRPSAALRERILAKRPRPRRPERPVFMILDMIADHLTPGQPLEVPRAREIVPALQRRLGEAREKKLPIIHVCDTHEEGDPDYGAWPMHALAGTGGADPIPELAPLPGEHVVRKPTYSAFNRSNLAELLGELGADEIVLTGCATELGLHATATDALQRGFVVTIPPDCQAGLSALTENVTLLTLATMPPYDPIYLRKQR
jgi:nicotinamidase/pyrazinamidase